MNCERAGCEKQLYPEKDGFHTCSLCNTPTYCSDECRITAWGTSHLCPNVINVETPSTSYGRPYFFEDFLTQEEIESLPIDSPVFDTFSLSSTSGNRLIKQWFQPPFVEGNAVSKDYAKGSLAKYTRGAQMPNTVREFWIDVYIDETYKATVGGMTNNAMIFDKSTIPAVKEVAKFTRQKNENKYVFWPFSTMDTTNITTNLEFDIRVDLRFKNSGSDVQVNVNDITTSISGAIKLEKQKDKYFRNVTKNLLSNFKTQLKAKFAMRKGVVTSIDNLVVRRLMDLSGNSVVLTFDMSTGSRPKLVDIEYEVPTSSLRGIDASIGSDIDSEVDEALQFVHCYACDPKDVDSVIGFCMALDHALVTMPKNDPNLTQLEKCASVIKQHAHALQENKGEASDFVSNQVATSISSAVDIMFVDAKATASMSRLADRPDDASVEIDKFDAKYGQDGKGLKHKAQQAKMKIQMEKLKGALKRRWDFLRKNGATQAKLDEYKALVARIQEIQARGKQ
jgi:hypothetical protein